LNGTSHRSMRLCKYTSIQCVQKNSNIEYNNVLQCCVWRGKARKGEERRGKAYKKLHEMKKRLIIIYTKRIFEKHWIHLQASMFYP